MLKSNKIMYCLLALAILVLLIGSNSANAASLDENNQTDSFEQRHANNEANIDKIEEKNIVDKTKTKNIIKTNDKKVSKGDNELKNITLTVENIECDYGNVTIDTFKNAFMKVKVNAGNICLKKSKEADFVAHEKYIKFKFQCP